MPTLARDADLKLMKNVAAWCAGSIEAIVALCDWHVQRPDDGGVLAFKHREGAKILAVAHLDYHCSGKVHELDEHHIVSSALDDRLGACLAYNLQAYAGVVADVVFCDKEEQGRSTLPLLGTKMLSKYNWIVEFDRRLEGAVCYQYTVMESYIKKHFELHIGSFSDICSICHTSPVGAFNVAVGYNNEHTEKCYATTAAIRAQMQRFHNFYQEFGDTKILHTPPAKTKWQERQSWGGWRGNGWDDDDDIKPGGYWRGGQHYVYDAKKKMYVPDIKPNNDSNKGTVTSAAHPRKWDSDNKGNIVPVSKNGADVVTPMELTPETRALLTRLGWVYNVVACCYVPLKLKDVVTILDVEKLKKSTLEEILRVEAAQSVENHQETADFLSEMYGKGDLSDEDIADYAKLGWHLNPETGKFFRMKVRAEAS